MNAGHGFLIISATRGRYSPSPKSQNRCLSASSRLILHPTNTLPYDLKPVSINGIPKICVHVNSIMRIWAEPSVLTWLYHQNCFSPTIYDRHNTSYKYISKQGNGW